jgi:hypothetical protein
VIYGARYGPEVPELSTQNLSREVHVAGGKEPEFSCFFSSTNQHHQIQLHINCLPTQGCKALLSRIHPENGI